jgi:hypothetical protein
VAGGVGPNPKLSASHLAERAPASVPPTVPAPRAPYAGFPPYGHELGYNQQLPPPANQQRGQWDEFSPPSSGFRQRSGSEHNEPRLPDNSAGASRFVDAGIELSAGAPVFVPKFSSMMTPPLPSTPANGVSVVPPIATAFPAAPASPTSLFPSSTSLPAAGSSLWGGGLGSGQSDLGLANAFGLGVGDNGLSLGLTSNADIWKLGGGSTSASTLDSTSHFSAFLSNPLSSLGSSDGLGASFGSSLGGLGDLGGLPSLQPINGRQNSESSLLSRLNVGGNLSGNRDLDYLSNVGLSESASGDDANSLSKLISQFSDTPNDMPSLSGLSRSLT